MTAVALKNRIIVADRQITLENECEGTFKTWEENKLFMFKGKILFTLGNYNRGDELLKWYKAGAIPDNFPKLRDKYRTGALGVVCKEKGLVLYRNRRKPKVYGFKTCAFGTGGDLALGAMTYGATAEEGILLAIKHNKYCGFGISKRKF